MLFDLRQIRGDKAHIERTFEPEAFDPPDEDYRVAAPVRLSMDVEKAGVDVYRVSGRVATRLEMACGRCLEIRRPRRNPRNKYRRDSPG